MYLRIEYGVGKTLDGGGNNVESSKYEIHNLRKILDNDDNDEAL